MPMPALLASIPDQAMTPREKMIRALNRQPVTGLVPHFELAFFLTMEALGRLHPTDRHLHKWKQMSERERDMHRRDVADVQVSTYRKFDLSGTIYNAPSVFGAEDLRMSIDHFRDISGDEFFVSLHGDCTHGVPGEKK